MTADHDPNPYRQPGTERDLILAAGRMVGNDATRLADFADIRAHDGPIRDLPTRDWGREIAEELADAANYCVWWIRLIAMLDDGQSGWGELHQQVGRVLAAVASAYYELQAARDLRY